MVEMDWLVRRPVAVVSAAFVVGAISETLAPEKSFVPVALFLFSLLALICAFFLRTHLLFFLTLFAFAIGCSVTRWRLPPIPQNLNLPFNGVIASSPLPTGRGYRVILRVGEGFAMLTFNSDKPTKWQIGDVVQVERCWVKVSNLRRHRFQRIFWVGRVDDESVALINRKTNSFTLARLRERWRQFVFGRWANSFPAREKTATISALASIVFGMRMTATSEEDERAFTRSGLVHLFVPSGSQVTLLMGLAWLANRHLNLPPLPLLILLLGFYLPLTRGEPSIYRAVLMGFYAFVGWKWWRDVDWQTSLWLSSALLAAIEPSMLHDVGFQLSYAATFGLIFASPVLLSLLRWLPDWLKFPIAATLSAQIFLTPVLVHYFGRVSLISPIANLCAVIPASFALTLGFISALVSLLSPQVAMPVSFVAGELAKTVVRMAHWFAEPPWASIHVSPISGWQTIAALAILTVMVAWMKRGEHSERS